ncbi:hypothetical protein HanRHA438_Chr14g0658131 [Helianthus annuus]|nr:hypothetical protein HanRHA438_Chr14g0658131 [Helianthus annuus]
MRREREFDRLGKIWLEMMVFKKVVLKDDMFDLLKVKSKGLLDKNIFKLLKWTDVK